MGLPLRCWAFEAWRDAGEGAVPPGPCVASRAAHGTARHGDACAHGRGRGAPTGRVRWGWGWRWGQAKGDSEGKSLRRGMEEREGRRCRGQAGSQQRACVRSNRVPLSSSAVVVQRNMQPQECAPPMSHRTPYREQHQVGAVRGRHDCRLLAAGHAAHQHLGRRHHAPRHHRGNAYVRRGGHTGAAHTGLLASLLPSSCLLPSYGQ